ncbi:MAG: hypothetical protein CSA15_07625 [Candidatus Delongbacteria bacterium]|nr:MAG: hypothetical protein CSA15_07625 [Candidatus Delongbacteria bacterium]
MAILDFNYFPDERYIRGITNKDIETNERYEKFDLKDIYFIELRKFNKELKFITNTLDRWVTFLTKASFFEKDNIPPELAVDPEVSEAVERLDIMYLNEKEQEIYEAEEKFRRDQYEIMRTAISKANRKGMEEGLKEGMEKGRKEGMEKGVKKGLKEGMEKGRKEGIEIGVEKGKIETAKNLLKNGVSVDIIKSSTGLSEEDIESLR